MVADLEEAEHDEGEWWDSAVHWQFKTGTRGATMAGSADVNCVIEVFVSPAVVPLSFLTHLPPSFFFWFT